MTGLNLARGDFAPMSQLSMHFSFYINKLTFFLFTNNKKKKSKHV